MTTAPTTTAPPGPPPAVPRTSGLAIASLICGIAGLVTCGLGALVGLVLGIVALVRISQSQGQMGGQGLAIAGILVSALCMVLVVVAGPPLLGLLILFREEMKEEVLDAWEEANPPPADDFFGGELNWAPGLHSLWPFAPDAPPAFREPRLAFVVFAGAQSPERSLL